MRERSSEVSLQRRSGPSTGLFGVLPDLWRRTRGVGRVRHARCSLRRVGLCLTAERGARIAGEVVFPDARALV